MRLSVNNNLSLWLLAAAFLLGGCRWARGESEPELVPGAIDTAAAETLDVLLTEEAAQGRVIRSPTPEPAAVQTQSPLENGSTAEQPLEGTPQPEADPCNKVRFIKDVTIPDNTDLEPGQEFTKTWRLENVGTCAWTAGYSLVFDRGDDLSGPQAIPISVETVEPGDTVDLSVDLVAPPEQGSYQSFWKLRTARGRRFGIGESSEAFWLKINVVEGSDLRFDFNRQADEAVWGSGQSPVHFEDLGERKETFGSEAEPGEGAVTLRNDQRLESGETSGWVLLMQPPVGAGQYIIGRFPVYQVKPGDRLVGQVGLIKNPGGPCGTGEVTYRIHYTVNNAETQVNELWSWQESCDGALKSLDLDLDFLAGDQVRFVLLVLADTDSEENYAVWDSLSIVR